MRISLLLLCLCSFLSATAQLLTWSPSFIQESSSTIEIILDATEGSQGLKNYSNTSDVYVHTGLITNKSTNAGDWKHVPFEWATTPDNGHCTYLGNNKWKFTITGSLRTFYNVTDPSEVIYKIAILFRNGAGTLKNANTNNTDMYVPVYAAGAKAVQFIKPHIVPTYVLSHKPIVGGVGVPVTVQAVALANEGALHLYYNGQSLATPVGSNDTITGAATATTSGKQEFIAELVSSLATYSDTISYFINAQNVVAPLPANVREGINYGSDCKIATLVLYAPKKDHVFVVGDFANNDWAPKPEYQMNVTPDGNYFWLTLNNLTAKTEYAFNYQVDDSIYIADPYTEKVLDPYNDQYISSATYPGLKQYPVNANVSAGKNGIMSVLQTCQTPYEWQVTKFDKPDSKNLMTYELLVRDFGNAANYQLLIDSMSYFKRLGINAIELMPVNEFAGNDSWGYNPTFYSALDKAYGTKNKLKEFVDVCHTNGIAVILDVVYNQMEAGVAPQGKLYWDASKNRPSADNPWLNIMAPHPYFPYQYDLNHNSPATKYLITRSMEYWLSEYKIDGFRIDAGKGFTQKCTQVNELCPVASGSIEDYDAGRVANLEAYYDTITAHFPGTYMIIEFLGQQKAEEQEYAKHGFMLWGNSNYSYNRATQGYSGSNFSKIVYNSNEQGFTTPAEMGYMESHDEERMMFRNLHDGNHAGTYYVEELKNALQRQAAAAALFFTVPGPKMFWQFGERGYDVSIDANGGRVSPKPPHWEYMNDPDRLQLFNIYAKLINLRLSNPSTFNSTIFTYDFYDNNGQFKRFQIADPAAAGMKVTVIANFDVVPQTRTVTFQTNGMWYNFQSNGSGSGLNGANGSTVTLVTTSQSITLQPGEYHVYIDRKIVLALDVVSFAGKRTNQGILLAWSTANSSNDIKHFSLERSVDGSVFGTLSTIASKATGGQPSYSYYDYEATAVKNTKTVYYRLKIVHNDGSFSYSSVSAIQPFVSVKNVSIYPNPVKDIVHLFFKENLPAKVNVRVYDVNGRVYRKLSVSVSGSNTINLDVSRFANGSYTVSIEAGEQKFVQQFVIQK